MLFPSRTRLQHSAAKKQARANARACFDRVSLIPVPVPCAPVCNPVYKIAFPVPFPAYSFLSPRRVGAFAGPSRLCSCVAGRKARKNRRCFVLSLGAILYTGSFFSGRTPPPALAAAFWGRSEGGLFAESAVLPFFSACKCLPEALPPLDSPPELRPPLLYTARPICWLTFPLGSDTISIKHRKGRPAPWPSS